MLSGSPDANSARPGRPSGARATCFLERYDRLSYRRALALQRERHAERMANPQEPGVLLVLEHDPVITIGRTGSAEEVLAPGGVEVVETDRGGAVTFHGPGQLVLYPILPLAQFRKDLGWYLRALEEVAMRALARFGVAGERVPGRSGLWVGREKVAALGVAVRRWITYHGLSFNYAVDLAYYARFVPCGIRDAGVASLDRLLDRPVTRGEVEPALLDAFKEVFEVNLAASGNAEPASAAAGGAA